jgi:hypothetical protein
MRVSRMRRCVAGKSHNLAEIIRQSRPDSGLGYKAKVLKTF